MTEAGTAIGPRLKAERERRGLSSQKAADELHLDGWVIDALEADDYERIGPSVYAKGHLRRYAALLELPSAEIMAGYESRAQAPRPPAAAAATPSTGATPPSKPDAMAGMGRARLRLSFSADSWVDVHDAAGRRVFAGNGRANSVKTIAGIAPMRVYLGFASGVQLEINNRAVAIGPQFMAGDVARFEAGADGVLRRDSRGTATPGTATPDVAAAAARPSG